MRVVITSQGDTMDSPVDPRFGRAQGFIVTDENGDEVEYVDNMQNLNAASGAGIQAAQNIVGKEAEVLLTGSVGPKAYSVLSSAKVKVFIGASGTVQEALDKYSNGELEEANSANVEGHW
ncbi:NifB/NifX family molybdenum-iron cluster-binding protein [Planctomycetota bacterium]